MTVGAVSMMLHSWRLKSDELGCAGPGCQSSGDAGLLVERQLDAAMHVPGAHVIATTEVSDISEVLGDIEVESLNFSLVHGLSDQPAAETVNDLDAGVDLDESTCSTFGVATPALRCAIPTGIFGNSGCIVWPASIVDVREIIDWQYLRCFLLAVAIALVMWARAAQRAITKAVFPTVEAQADFRVGVRSIPIQCALVASQKRAAELEQRCYKQEMDAEIQASKLEHVETTLQQRNELLQQMAGELAELEQWAHDNEPEIQALRHENAAQVAKQHSESLSWSNDHEASLAQSLELTETRQGIARIEELVETVLTAFARTDHQSPAAVQPPALRASCLAGVSGIEHVIDGSSSSGSISSVSSDSGGDVCHIDDKLGTSCGIPAIGPILAESDEETHAPTTIRSPRSPSVRSSIASRQPALASKAGTFTVAPTVLGSTPWHSDPALRMALLTVSDAEMELCNGDYVFERMRGSRPLFKSETGAVIFFCAFSRCWKMCSTDSTSSWHYCAGAPEDEHPPSGKWAVRDMQDGNVEHSAPSVAVINGASAVQCGWPCAGLVESPYGN